MTAWEPTIWEVGVTSGGMPASRRTAWISSCTSRRRSRAFISLSWLMRLDVIPPGIWWAITLSSMRDRLPEAACFSYLGARDSR